MQERQENVPMVVELHMTQVLRLRIVGLQLLKEKEMLVRFSKRQRGSEESNSGDNMFRVIIAGSRSFANCDAATKGL